MSLIIVLCCIVGLVLLISWAKVNPFISFLIIAIITGLLLKMPANKIVDSLQTGMGDTLSSLAIIVSLGAMLGKLVAETGVAQKIASVVMDIAGIKNIKWALAFTGFVVGIPLFYPVAFVLMIPLIFSVVYKYKLPAVYVGLPMLASLSVTHGFLPPHPSPSALVMMFHANMGTTLLYGICIAIPAIIIAGPLYASTLKKIVSPSLQTFQSKEIAADKLPSAFSSFAVALLPVLLIATASVLPLLFHEKNIIAICAFVSEPSILMLIALITATATIGFRTGKTMKELMSAYAESVKDIAMILLIFGGAGSFKQILSDSGVSNEIANALQSMHLQPLILAWLIAAIIRVCVGSATVAGLTTAGIILPMMNQPGINPSLMVLSIGAGSLMFSHVNDIGFWMFKEYFNLSVKDTIRSWSVMESIVSVIGLMGVLLFNLFV
ncbi:Gnt-II system L-idonate transporter [mine drainage metagenome]|uniref:Gnt-II system L-idonate transporter n=1 Tax=mine drainage metagenome TaxID=410659 RepID=A0A1J5SUT3_9ZZZZ